jgi:hypothetical protein
LRVAVECFTSITGARYHLQLAALLKDYEGRFPTTWLVVTESFSLMPGRTRFTLISGGK